MLSHRGSRSADAKRAQTTRCSGYPAPVLDRVSAAAGLLGPMRRLAEAAFAVARPAAPRRCAGGPR